MGYSQNNPLPRMNSALKRAKDERRMGIDRNSSPANNASKYGIQGIDELKYMPIEDDMHRKQDSPAHLDSELADMPIRDIEKGDAEGDITKQKLDSQNDGMSRHTRDHREPKKAEQEAEDLGMSRYGAMKGDQSATHTDYANYKGTDKGYHGHDGSSHGDQSATHRDYLKGNAGCHHVGGKKGMSRNASPLNGFNAYTSDTHKHPHKEGMSMSHPDEGMSRDEYKGMSREEGMYRKSSPMNKDNWIQDVTADIKKRGTEGVCTGDKFGGPTCPPGSKRYNLAKTFKKMAKNR